MINANLNAQSKQVITQDDVKNHFVMISMIMSFRRDQGISIKEFSQLAQLDETKVEALEAGDYWPSEQEISFIKKVLS
jgi:ribosome-binding protein aMBF1 (putative translation factor)